MADTPVEVTWNDLRALVEQVEDYAMFVLDLDGHVASWNRGAQKIKGYAAGEIIGQHFSKFYPAEDIASGKPQRELADALATGHVEDEGWRIRADGTRFWAFVSITLLRDDSGAPRGFGKVTRDLTERRNAQEALRRSEERFRLLVEGVADYAIYMLDPHGVVATWNAGAQKIKGYSAEQIIGREFSLFFTPEDRAQGRPQKELATAAAEGRFEEEGWRVRADGSHFWASVVVSALHDRSGQLVGFTKVTRDLTARKQAEDTARQRERFRVLSEQLGVILDGVVDGITVQDRNGKLVFANSAAARLTGLTSREELLEIGNDELLQRFEMSDEQGQPFLSENLPGRRVLAGERSAEALLCTRDRFNGRTWWAQIRSNAVLGDDGLPELAVNIWHDVSHERRREEHDRYLNEVTAALSKSLDYQATLDTLANLLVPGLCDWCIIHLLDGAELKAAAVAHTDPKNARRAREYQQKHPPSPEEETAGVWQVIRTGEPILLEQVPQAALLENVGKAEQLELAKNAGACSVMLVPIKVREQVSGTMSLIAAESGRRYDAEAMSLAAELGRRVGTFIENAQLYERTQAAAERAEAAAREAETAGRLKDEFLATVSHELRTPLNAILGWSSMLKVRADPALVAKGIAVINRNAAAQSKIIEDILDVSRIITGQLRLELRPVDLVSIVADAIEVVRPSAVAREISIVFDRPPEPSFLVGDPERLQQVMWNLLSNAVKFNDRGGRVEVRIEQRGSQLSLTVADNGKGIDEAFLPYVFERFKQADGSTTRRFGGLGLGLAIVRHIVELHGGRVAVASLGPGRGASFEVILPVQALAPAAEEPQGTSSDRPANLVPVVRLEGLRVLVVDDEADARDLVELVLTQAGAKVRTANSAAAGLAAIAPFQPDVIVSDIGMADEDGYALMRRVRALPAPFATTPAIALTAYTRRADKLKALSTGFSVHLGKPVNPDDLTVLVAKLGRQPS